MVSSAVPGWQPQYWHWRLSRENRFLRVNGTTQRFDAVVFATPPGEILPTLTDADDGERRRLGAWRSRPIQTVVHTDEGNELISKAPYKWEIS